MRPIHEGPTLTQVLARRVRDLEGAVWALRQVADPADVPPAYIGFEQQCDDLRGEVYGQKLAIAAALRIHRPCHTNVSDEPCRCGAPTAHCLPANEPRCGVCLVDNGPEEWTYEVWPCATAQALGATR